MTTLKTTAILSALALVLAGCGDDTEDPVVGSEMADAEVNQTVEYDPMTRDYTLSDEAQARRDTFDADAFQSEYAGYRDEISDEQVEPASAGDDNSAASTDGSASGADTAMSEDDRCRNAGGFAATR